MERFGTFFIHDLDIQRGHHPELVQEDDNRLLNQLKVKRRTRPLVPRIAAWGQDPEDVESITWSQLNDILDNHVDEFIHLYNPGNLNILDENAIELFIKFTTDYWTGLSEQFMDFQQLPPITSLHEALQRWSVEFMRDNCLQSIEFKPCNNGMEGPISGQRVMSFTERRTWFFPLPVVKIKPNSAWEIFRSDGGYLHLYKQLLDSCSSMGISSMHEALDVIFGFLLCLPLTGGRQSLWCCSKQGKSRLKIIVNPRYYKIKRLKRERTGPHGPRAGASTALVRNRAFLATGKKMRKSNTGFYPNKVARRRREQLDREKRLHDAQKAKGKKMAKEKGKGKKGAKGKKAPVKKKAVKRPVPPRTSSSGSVSSQSSLSSEGPGRKVAAGSKVKKRVVSSSSGSSSSGDVSPAGLQQGRSPASSVQLDMSDLDIDIDEDEPMDIASEEEDEEDNMDVDPDED